MNSMLQNDVSKLVEFDVMKSKIQCYETMLQKYFRCLKLSKINVRKINFDVIKTQILYYKM